MVVDLKVLIVEDSEKDAALLLRKLKEAGYNPIYQRVQTHDDMKKSLAERQWDIILSDYVMPDFNGLAALELLNQTGIDIPFIVISGQIGEDVAVATMKAGASDYLMKSNLKRLGAAIARELVEAENRRLRRRAEKELLKSEAELRVLSHRLIKMQEDERRSLARELHDETGHTLAYLRLLVDRVGQLPPQDAKKTLDEAKSLLSDLIEQIRNLSLSLKPPMLEEDGLLQAVKYLTERYSREVGIKIVLSQSELSQSLPWDTSLAAYRIIQESITNIIKHAKANEITVNIWTDQNNLHLNITDNGVGFTKENSQSGSGLRNMHERAAILGGTLRINSNPGGGTSVDAVIPIADK